MTTPRGYMSIRTHKILIRFVLILISFQFLAPSFLWSTGDKLSTLSVSTEKSIHSPFKKALSLSSLLELIEEEREDERHKRISFEASDDLLLASRITLLNTSYYSYTNRTNLFASHPPLFVLNCAYLI